MSAITLHLQIKDYTKCLVDAVAKAELIAMNELFGVVKQRVFNQNITTDLNNFGGYKSDAYKKKRESLGLQTNSKDLQLSGELRKDFIIGVDDDKNVVYGFSTDRSNEIRGYQEQSEKQIGKEIFYPNDEEIELALEDFYSEIEKCKF